MVSSKSTAACSLPSQEENWPPLNKAAKIFMAMAEDRKAIEEENQRQIDRTLEKARVQISILEIAWMQAKEKYGPGSDRDYVAHERYVRAKTHLTYLEGLSAKEQIRIAVSRLIDIGKDVPMPHFLKVR